MRGRKHRSCPGRARGARIRNHIGSFRPCTRGRYPAHPSDRLRNHRIPSARRRNQLSRQANRVFHARSSSHLSHPSQQRYSSYLSLLPTRASEPSTGVTPFAHPRPISASHAPPLSAGHSRDARNSRSEREELTADATFVLLRIASRTRAMGCVSPNSTQPTMRPESITTFW